MAPTKENGTNVYVTKMKTFILNPNYEMEKTINNLKSIKLTSYTGEGGG